uniref:Surfeit gene 1 n=1 Tax=Mus musculus TaxID=10090 RepID=A0A0R4J232_MOUSE
MAAVMALAVLPRRMTRWSQWAYAGRAQFCAVRRSVFGFSVRSGLLTPCQCCKTSSRDGL